MTEKPQFRVDDVITNGSSAGKVIEIMTGQDPRWKTPGVRLMNIGLEQYGGNQGASSFVPDYLLSGWYLVPFEWKACVGAQVEERYVWSVNYRWLQREVRVAAGHDPACPHCGGSLAPSGEEGKVMPTVDGIRGHQVTTAEQDEVRRDLALAAEPITAEAVERLLDEIQ